MVDKSVQNETFYELDKAKQTAIVLLFEDKLSDEQIAKTVNRSRTTLSNWKKDNKFKQAQIEYRRVAIDSYVPDAIKRLHKLAIGAKSEMVSLQAAQSILSMAGFGSVDSSPELEQAKIEKAKADVRKLTAEADIKEAEAKAVGNTDSSGITLEIIRTDRRGQSDETKS
ncbi:helix-turn-helix domain-containing protein [Latilactobacillus curvatus]|uniref:helix-turn-helix domain-containing protein n=1 Tax=Latilactobacillus curvatus TaxID=28038 RepID=UPI001CBAAB72|nr:helix-turn-helix domain-containing protein [Latilactobacillus curvatus]MBZ1504041.1 helix-turn-helix domain-containing protein [Latilactobacillus curvatus]